MRLLDKKSVQTSIANDRKIEIDEGLKIARKVDGLRSTLSEEESRLNKFRTETTSKVQSEISEQITKRDSLLSEVKVLEEKRIELLRPLDYEWARINRANVDLENLQVELEYKSKQLSELESSLALSMKDMKTEEQRLEDLRTYIEQDRQKADTDRLQASVELKTVLQEKETILSVLRAREELITSREAEVAIKEREVNMIDKSLKSREKAVTKKEREVNDKYETLQRTLKRNGKR